MFALLLCLTISSGARAQYHWTITHPSQIGSTRYSFLSVSCRGNCCTAAGFVIDSLGEEVNHFVRRAWNIMLFRSNDAGLTWAEQDPHLAPYKSSNQNMLNKIQQIDSLNVVAVGDSGLVLRTFDAGETWIRQDLHTQHNFFDVHFSDPANGIIIANLDTNVYVTSDSGKTWKGIVLSQNLWPIAGHAYGPGKFKVITISAGPFYSTTNNWMTYDSSVIYPITDTNHDIEGCSFGSGDTIVAWALHTIGGIDYPWMCRTSDGGKHWSDISPPSQGISNFFCISSPDNAPMMAGGQTAYKRIERSEDAGQTWQLDTLDLPPTFAFGLSLAATSSACFVGAFAGDHISRGDHGILARGEPASSRVERTTEIPAYLQAFPNPATDYLTVTFDGARSILLLDVLGREVGRVNPKSPVPSKLDISTLRAGVYYLTDGHSQTKFVKE